MRHFFLTEEDAFFEEVPALFAKNQAAESPRYEDVIYRLKPQATSADVPRVARFLAVDEPKDPERLAKALNAAVARSQYPSAECLSELRGHAVLGNGELARSAERSRIGVSLPLATGLLHFFRPAYPLYRENAVRALAALGYSVEWRTEIDERGLGAYEGVVAAVDRLKTRIPYPFVPESNCFLTRVIEGALNARGGPAISTFRSKAAP